MQETTHIEVVLQTGSSIACNASPSLRNETFDSPAGWERLLIFWLASGSIYISLLSVGGYLKLQEPQKIGEGEVINQSVQFGEFET